MFAPDFFVQQTTIVLLLSLLSFFVAILLTPLYTHYAYKHKWWKLERTHSASGEKLSVITKYNIKRNVPLMAGLVTMISITLVTLVYNMDRQQTWLPLAALIGGGIVGLIDDIINVRGKGGNVAGLTSPDQIRHDYRRSSRKCSLLLLQTWLHHGAGAVHTATSHSAG
jgi:UDP-N-acetylmuramyl pentapeptide phosphotransferase/UDP-N-acetylglucosamine-1-phosphate transferase